MTRKCSWVVCDDVLWRWICSFSDIQTSCSSPLLYDSYSQIFRKQLQHTAVMSHVFFPRWSHISTCVVTWEFLALDVGPTLTKTHGLLIPSRISALNTGLTSRRNTWFSRLLSLPLTFHHVSYIWIGQWIFIAGNVASNTLQSAHGKYFPSQIHRLNHYLALNAGNTLMDNPVHFDKPEIWR